jgi:hypothetical protein
VNEKWTGSKSHGLNSGEDVHFLGDRNQWLRQNH